MNLPKSEFPFNDTNQLSDSVHNASAEMLELLCRAVQIESLSGKEASFTRFIENWARKEGFETDLWEADEQQLASYSQFAQNHMPLSGRPTLVVRLPGSGNGSSLILNAHADVVGAGELKNWSVEPFGGIYQDGRVYGRGACDTKGPLVAGLWAMLAIRRNFPQGLLGDVMLELIPGEEHCVGIGTLTSIIHGYRADAAIVLEPTENIPRCASRGGLRFEIDCIGKAVHGTVKWLGRDAIVMMRAVLEALDMLQRKFNDPAADSLFADYPIARPITVDKVVGGKSQGVVCDKCSCSGYFELLPADNNNEWKKLFEDELHRIVGNEGIEVRFSEEYAGHVTDPKSKMCVAAESIMKSVGGENTELNWNGWSAFNSGCEAGVRANLQKTPTLVWGPGSLVQAHANDEFVSFPDVEMTAELLAKLMVYWSSITRPK